MKFWQTLVARWNSLTSYLGARDVPTWTQSIADGVQKGLTTLLLMPLRLLATLPPRLLIFLTAIAILLIGVLIIWMF